MGVSQICVIAVKDPQSSNFICAQIYPVTVYRFILFTPGRANPTRFGFLKIKLKRRTVQRYDKFGKLGLASEF